MVLNTVQVDRKEQGVEWPGGGTPTQPPPQRIEFSSKNAGFYAFLLQKKTTSSQQLGPRRLNRPPWELKMYIVWEGLKFIRDPKCGTKELNMFSSFL